MGFKQKQNWNFRTILVFACFGWFWKDFDENLGWTKCIQAAFELIMGRTDTVGDSFWSAGDSFCPIFIVIFLKSSEIAQKPNFIYKFENFEKKNSLNAICGMKQLNSVCKVT